MSFVPNYFILFAVKMISANMIRHMDNSIWLFRHWLPIQLADNAIWVSRRSREKVHFAIRATPAVTNLGEQKKDFIYKAIVAADSGSYPFPKSDLFIGEPIGFHIFIREYLIGS